MPVIEIDNLDDPRLDAYRQIKDRELARDGGLFIAEGQMLVRRLIASDFPTVSVLLAKRKRDRITPIVPPDVPAYVVPDDLIKPLLGFQFHSGIMAVGRRKPGPALEEIVTGKTVTLVVCPDLISTENMGSVVRVAAALGADGMLLGQRCCDPFWRKSVRVSMGSVFTLPIVRSGDIAADLQRLKNDLGFELVASVLAADAQPMDKTQRGPKLALLLGNEAQGLDQEIVALCDRRVTIPMRRGTDSLNVAVAAAVMLWELGK